MLHPQNQFIYNNIAWHIAWHTKSHTHKMDQDYVEPKKLMFSINTSKLELDFWINWSLVAFVNAENDFL